MNKILLINTYYYPNGQGGAEKSVQILAESFVRHGFQVAVFTTSDRSYEDHINGVDVYYFQVNNQYWLPESSKHKTISKMIWHLRDSYGFVDLQPICEKIKLISPDIVITNNLVGFSSKIWLLVNKLQIPLIHIIRDHYQLSPTTTITENLSIIEKCFYLFILSARKKYWSKHVNHVVGISNYILKKHLELGYFKNSTTRKTIYNPLPLSRIPAIKKQSRNTVFGYIGALNARKGIFLLLQEFVQNNIQNALLIFGDGSSACKKRLLSICDYKSNIRYLGYQNHASMFNAIDILIVPSLINEAFGRVIIEAYSYGVPVIGSNRGGIPELIIEGVTGYLFNPDKDNDLFNVINSNSLDEFVPDYLITNVKNHAVQFYPDHIISLYMDLLGSFDR